MIETSEYSMVNLDEKSIYKCQRRVQYEIPYHTYMDLKNWNQPPMEAYE